MAELTYGQQYYLKNRDRLLIYLKERIQCKECGTVCMRINMSNHRKSAKHIKHKEYLEDLARAEMTLVLDFD